ncbi:hypothetical protein SADUNF_Sadunf08G0151400 [Salix dunnii]|uniref:mRNA export factor GLE1 n=1 Tax=Salix dunnii TaxID=1413687 RepID=A0A835N1S6_9ROSI|nr:hypothetical protein SADUNF_Sadunf08G0151400 [Salix dunnii]
MGAFKLELRCPQKVHGIVVDPECNWSFESLSSELHSLEKKLHDSCSVPVPFTKAQSREFWNRKGVKRSPGAFVMSLSNKETELSESEGEEDHVLRMVTAKRFNCDDLYMSDSDSSDYEVAFNPQSYLMDEVGLVESAFFERSHEHHLQVQEDIRNQLSAIETELMTEQEKYASAFARIEKYREARKELERKLDIQYQRKIAEALDNHLTAIQREHELKSQIEERRIRSDAAHEEAKRKERAFHEERLRQERARVEAEAKLRIEEKKKAALEAERRAAKEAGEKEASEAAKRIAAVPSQQEAAIPQLNADSSNLNLQPQGSGSNRTKKSQTTGDVVRAAQTALTLAQGRLLKLKELEEANQTLIMTSNMDFSNHERHISRLIRQIRGIKENVRVKASELVKILRNPSCPQTISVAAFAKKVIWIVGLVCCSYKVVSHCESPDNAVFACGHVIVLVTSQVPQAMDLLLAEFHRACIYTVPKHIVYSKNPEGKIRETGNWGKEFLNLQLYQAVTESSVFESKEAYYKDIGHREDDGKLESVKDYLKRLESYMKLYGALVQTEVQGVPNIHGPKEGWAWLARFLNALPANMYTAVALNAFLQTAGFVLFRKYKSQFTKMLLIILNDFLKALREREDSELNPIILEIQSYIEDNKFCQEPEGRSLQGQLLSSRVYSY